MAKDEISIGTVVMDLAQNYKKIGQSFNMTEIELNHFRMRYDTEVYEYIDKFSSSEEQKKLLIDLYVREKVR